MNYHHDVIPKLPSGLVTYKSARSSSQMRKKRMRIVSYGIAPSRDSLEKSLIARRRATSRISLTITNEGCSDTHSAAQSQSSGIVSLYYVSISRVCHIRTPTLRYLRCCQHPSVPCTKRKGNWRHAYTKGPPLLILRRGSSSWRATVSWRLGGWLVLVGITVVTSSAAER